MNGAINGQTINVTATVPMRDFPHKLGGFNNDDEKAVWVAAFCAQAATGRLLNAALDDADDMVMHFRARGLGTQRLPDASLIQREIAAVAAKHGL